MPILQLNIELTPEEFLKKCSPAELVELQTILNRIPYQARMKGAEFIEVEIVDDGGEQAINHLKHVFNNGH